MRIQLVRQRDEGASAVILVFVIMTLIFFAAFVTDYGVAFVSKRNLQNGADAGALTAANTMAQVDGTCAELASNGTETAKAIAAADAISLENRKDRILTTSTDATWTNAYYRIACDTANRSLEVWYRNGGTTDTLFGGVFGSSRTAAERYAVASVGVPSKLEGLRPYMICIGDAQQLQSNRSSVLPVYFPACLPKGPGFGNWYTIQCPPPNSGGGNPTLEANTRLGCRSKINIVDTTSATTEPEMIDLLIAACTPKPMDSDGVKGCMAADTGRDMTSAGVADAWHDLLGKDIVLPVFDYRSVTGTGANTRYPVKALLGVRVCGYNWVSARDTAQDITNVGLCAGAAYPSAPTTQDYALLKYRRLVFAGSSEPSTCSLGDPDCDLGLRTVSLIQ